MLSKEYRLTKQKDFEKVFKRGKSYSYSFLKLKIIKNNLSTSRFGFVVSLKISKKAAVRNRIRRQLNEIARLELKQIKAGFDIVILTQKEIFGKKYLEIEQILILLLKKSNLLK